MIVCGREFSAEVIARLGTEGRARSRRSLSRLLCQWLDWKGSSGAFQTTNARIALTRLERLGLLKLPPAQRFGSRSKSPRAKPVVAWPTLGGSLAQIGPVALVLVGHRHSAAAHQCRHLLEEFHPLGSRLCGAQLRYLIRCPQGVLGVLCFSAAARRLRGRDQWIGWHDTARGENLHRIVNNSRFLIRPGVEVRCLASHVLALALKRLPGDWQQRYGYEPCLVESFVEKAKYRGSSYRASNWLELAETTAGRGRNDPEHKAGRTPERIFLYPLVKKVRQALCPLPEKLRLSRGQPALAAPVAPTDWAEEELGQAQLGDQRLRERLLVVARDFYARPQSNVPQSCDGNRAKTKAVYRLLDHPQVTMDAVLQSHYQATMARLAPQAVVLAVQDTTRLNYHTHPATEHWGPISKTADGAVGLLVHETMAFTLEGTPLGLLDLQCWARDPKQFGKDTSGGHGPSRRRKVSNGCGAWKPWRACRANARRPSSSAWATVRPIFTNCSCGPPRSPAGRSC